MVVLLFFFPTILYLSQPMMNTCIVKCTDCFALWHFHLITVRVSIENTA